MLQLFVEVAREVAAAWNATGDVVAIVLCAYVDVSLFACAACVVAPSLPEPAAAADGAHIPADGGVACEPSTTATAYRYPPTT